MRIALITTTVAASMGALACSQLLGADDYRAGASGTGGDSGPKTDAGSGSTGVDLGCLGSVDWPPPAVSTLSFGVSLVWNANGYFVPVQGLVGRYCYEALTNCGSPEGEVEQPVPGGWSFASRDPYSGDRFFGHLAVRDPNAAFMDYLFYFFPWPHADASTQVAMWKRTDLAAMLTDTELDPTLGILAFDVYDCGSVTDGYLLPPSGGGRPVPGVRVAIEARAMPRGAPEPTTFYGYPPYPDPEGRTDAYGQVYISNVPDGPVLVRATVDGLLLGEVTVHLEAGRVTAFHMVPTPIAE